MSVTKALRNPASSTSHAIATELRGMAGELMARSDVAREEGRHLSTGEVARVLLARADAVEGIPS